MRRKRLLPALAGAILAVTAAGALAATQSHTLKVRKDVHVTNANFAADAAMPVNKHEAVAVGAAGYAVYTFQGETRHHFICHKTTNANTNCWAFWPPVSVASASGLSKQAGIRGHLGTVRRNGIRQLTLNGQPLYYFTPDIQSGNRHRANGDELHTFGSIWHVVVAHVGTTQTAPTQPNPTSGGGGGSGSGSGGGYGPGY